MRQIKDIDLPATERDAIIWIEENLSTRRKSISANYTRNGFEPLKKFPNIWSIINGKQLKLYRGNLYSFIANRSYSIQYLGREFRFADKRTGNCSSRKEKCEKLQQQLDACRDDKQALILLCSETKLLRGCMVKCVNKLLQHKFNTLEELYCFAHDINKSNMSVDGHNIKFYDTHRGYQFVMNDSILARDFSLQGTTISDRIKFLLLNDKGKSAARMYRRYVEQTNNQEDILRYAFTETEYPKGQCLNCSSETDFECLSTGYRDFCCPSCVCTYYSQIVDDPELFADWSKLARIRLHRWYKNKGGKATINPEGLSLGIVPGTFQIDHIKPLALCFNEGWSILQANDVSNLQLMEVDEHRRKTRTDIEAIKKARRASD